MRIAAGERALFVGQPGAGKTNAICCLLTGLSSVVVLDSKCHEDEYARWGPGHGYVVTQDPEDIARHALVVYQPDAVDLMDTGAWKDPAQPWTRALQLLFERGRTVAVFDEVLQTLPSGRPHPFAVRAYTQGRKFGLSVWAGAQIANRMETLTARLAEHCFVFPQFNDLDLKLLRAARGVDPSMLKPRAQGGVLDQYCFGYHRVGTGAYEICQPFDNVIDSAPRAVQATA